MNVKKHIAQDAFLRPALDTLEIDTEDDALFLGSACRNRNNS